MSWAPAYATADELRSWIEAGTIDEDELDLVIEAASRAVDRTSNRTFGLVDAPESRYFQADYHRGRWVVDVDDLMTTVGLTVEVGAQTVTDYTLTPLNAPAKGRPWTGLELPTSATMPIKVTARWGWSAVPDAVKVATLIQASRLYARRQAPFGISGSPETGGELRLLQKLDVDLMTSVAPYRRLWAAV